jgi:hypothetical protein
MGAVTYYVMNGRQYVRKKSSLTRKRVLKSKAFEKTRQCATKMGIAAQIGSVIYKALPTDYTRERWFYRAITGEAASLLYEGKEEQEVKELLWNKYITATGAIPEGKEPVEEGKWNPHPASQETNLKLREAFYDRWHFQGLSYSRFKHAWSKRRSFNPDRFLDELNQAVLERWR